MAKKTGKGNDVTFEMQFLAFLIAYVKINNIFLESWDKTGQDKHVFEENFDCQNLTFFDLVWPYIDLSSFQT